MSNIPYKNITSLISSRQENSTVTSVNNGINSGVTFTLCDRTDLTNKESNYFISFRLPHAEGYLSTGSTLSLQNPELQQLNVDRMVISPIPSSYYAEVIDGRSVTLTIPQLSGSTSVTGLTVVSSTYGHLTKSQNSTMLGSNIAFLFCDDINKPRTGTTNNGVESVLSRASWNATSFVNRPPAHGYSDLSPSDINSDQRAWSGVNLAVNISESYPTNTNQGYNYDIPVGFVALDKGFVVLTHPDIVDNIPWNQGFQIETNTVNTGATSATTSIYFDNSVSQVTFNSIDINFRTSIVCLALPTEFVFSTNPSWDLNYNLSELNNGTNGFTPIQVTEIGLYNKLNELIAIAKLDRPVEKTYTNLITFNLDIDV